MTTEIKTGYEARPILSRNSVSAPTLPPKPIHLTSAFTGTLGSDAFKTYIERQSLHRASSQAQLRDNVDSQDDDLNTVKLTSELRIHVDDEDDEEGDLKWGTARQSPDRSTYGNLANLFTHQKDETTSSEMTIKPQMVYQRPEDDGAAALHPFASLKLPRRKKKGQLSSSPVTPKENRASLFASSSSPSETQRSREPSVISQISLYADGDEVTLDAPLRTWLVVKDGSSFEHAGPGSVSIAPISQAVIPPAQQDERAFLTAGPPPIRPQSRAIELQEEPLQSAVDEPTPEAQQNDDQVATSCTKIDSSINSSSSSSAGCEKRARALYAFEGKASFNELSLSPGQIFDIVKEDMGGGWSLAITTEKGKKGLVPHGWYTYIQDFSSSPNSIATEVITPIATLPVPLETQDRMSESKVSPLLSPLVHSSAGMSRSKTTESHILSPSEASEQQKRWDRTRPASALGQVFSGIPQSGSAIQVLTHMQRTGSAPSSSIVSRGPPSILSPSTVGEVSYEEINTSVSHSASSEGIEISTGITTPANGETAETTQMKANSFFNSNWKPSGILGRRMLNRFAPFVTSGAEEYILRSPTRLTSNENIEQTKIQITSGQHGGACWKHPGISIFVKVEAPEVHLDESGHEYVAYKVFSSYILIDDGDEGLLISQQRPSQKEPSMTSRVYRRFQQFKWLYTYLLKVYPTLMILMPLFPNASYTAGKRARLDLSAAEQRRRHLESWLVQVVRHPILSNEAAVRFFLDCEEEGEEWNLAAKVVQQEQEETFESSKSLFSRLQFPHFNVDAGDAELEVDQIKSYVQAFQKSMSTAEIGLLPSFHTIREMTSTSSESYRQLSYALLRLITGSDGSKTKNASLAASLDGQLNLPPMGKVGCRDSSGATNEERAWCWREGCKECKALTRSIQNTAETLQLIADTHERHSNDGLYNLHDQLANLARATSQQNNLIEVHKATLAMYDQASGEERRDDTRDVSVNERIATRCESVLNVTMSEMDRIHTEKIQDWTIINKNLIDGQIGFYEDILTKLKQARDENAFRQDGQDEIVSSNGALLPSPYEVHLNNPIRAEPLLQPQAPSSSSSLFGIW